MKGFILEKYMIEQMKKNIYFPSLKFIFQDLYFLNKDFNWLITDCECNPEKKEYFDLFNFNFNETLWITGEKLSRIVIESDFQWIWASLSGFKKDVKEEDVLKYKRPYARDNPVFWQNPVSIQHPLAEVELVPWDGMHLLFIIKNNKYANIFYEKFPLAKDLETYNRLL